MGVRFLLVPVIIAFLVFASTATGESPGVPSTTPWPGDLLLPTVRGDEPGPWGGSSPSTTGAEIVLPSLQPEAVNERGLDILLPRIHEPVQPLIPDPDILSPSPTSPEIPGTSAGQPADHLVSCTGTIRWIDLEGGFFGIESDDGASYLPLNLGDEYRVDGMRVAFSGYPAPGTVTIQMWGTPLTLLSISGIDGPLGEILVKYHRFGGIAGFNDELIIYGNGTALISRRGQSASISLSGSDLDALIQAGEEAGFPGLSREYLPDEGACDLFFYVVTWKGITVYTADTAVPASLVPLLDHLNRIVSIIPPWQ